MEHIDTFLAPQREILMAEADQLAQHAKFDAALGNFCDGLNGYALQVRALNIGAVDTLRWALAALSIAFEGSGRRANSANLIRLCGLGGLCGPAAVRSNLAAMAAHGLVTLEVDDQDRRVRRVRPTETLLALMRAGLAIRLAALEQVRALPAPAAVWAARPGILPQFMARNVRAFASGFLLTDGFPEVAGMMAHQGGYQVLLELIARARAEEGVVTSVVAPSHGAEIGGVSRTHVRKLLNQGAEQGWLSVEGPGGLVRLSPETYGRLRQWIAMEFAWTWRLVGEASAEYR